MSTPLGSDHNAAIAAARDIMAAHLKALNAGDEDALAATLHFPHYRLSGGVLKSWEEPGQYFADFKARAGDGWHHTVWDSIDVLAAEADKVHLDVRFARYRADGSVMGRFRSLWVIARLDGVWGAQLRSSFAP
ncbi:MAG: hypothetical protein KKB37_04475 [Alphaproteobacteria bacterium]|nr:hypothetical protein [Alphaproteobacteria bacterium]